MKHPNLPRHIIQIPNSKIWYVDSKTGQRINVKDLGKYCPKEKEPVKTKSAENVFDPLKDELIRDKRWDLK
jgi:hypothetical protein